MRGWLLRTFDEAASAWHGGSAGGGCILMPSQWHEGSYPELELRLHEMRDNGGRFLWWHVMRYRAGETRRLVVPLRALKGRDPKPILPENSRLVADGQRQGRKRAVVLAYLWDPRVDQRVADAGLEALVKIMYDGDRGRIVLPPSVLAQVGDSLP